MPDDQQMYLANMLRNSPYATSGPYQTPMTPEQQSQFYQWARATGAPITPDYDMPGFYASGGRGPSQGGHYTDQFKTPLHETFSNESKYAKNIPGAPYWTGAQHNQYVPPGVPTAEQEALQAPAVDPVFAAAMGPTFGLRQMLRSLAMGTLASSLGQGQFGTHLSMIPGPNLLKIAAENPAADAMTDRMYQIGKQQIMHTMKEAGMTKDMTVQEIKDMAKEIFWQDKPDFGTMVGKRGKTAQVAENLSDLLRSAIGEGSGARPLDYPLQDIGRPLGLAAIVADVKHHLGFNDNEVPNPK